MHTVAGENMSEMLHNALKTREGETIEFRSAFGNDALRTLCAFANTRGGSVWVGVADDGTVTGASVGRESLRDWAARIRRELGINAGLETVISGSMTVVRIVVPESGTKPIRHRGRAYVRSGSTDRIATEDDETRWVLERAGRTWDAIPEHGCRWEDLDPTLIRRFRKMCLEKGRRALPEDEDDKMILLKLGLLSEPDAPTRAAVLLFAKLPQRFHPNAVLKAGRFRSPTMIVDDREIGGTLFDQVEEAMTYFRKHLQTRFEFAGEPSRDVVWEYPLEAIREAIINAVCHRDYVDGGHAQVRWHDDHLIILNPGGLPPPLRLEDLKRPHRSVLRNRLIAEAFYNMGWIERWGGGIQKMLDGCRGVGLPEPEFEEMQGAFWVTFRKDVFTEERLRSLGMSDRQIRAVLWTKQKGRITNADYQAINQVSKRTASHELGTLEAGGLLERVGTTGKGTYYTLKGQQRGERGSKGAANGQQGPKKEQGPRRLGEREDE